VRRILVALVTGAFALGASSCGSSDDGPDIATIQVTPNPVAIQQAQTAQLQVSVLNSAGQLVTGIPVTFTSSDAAIASVSNTGLVTAGHSGAANVVVKAADLRTTVPVTVAAVPNQVTVTPNPGVVPQNGTLQLVAVVTDLAGQPVTNPPLTWSTSSATLATVSAAGLVDPVGPAGQVSITVQSGTLSATVPVAITQVATSLTVAPNPIRIGKSGSLQLAPAVRDAVGAPIAGVVFTYLSSNPALATVSTTGLVQGKGSTGTGNITVSSGSLSTVTPLELVDVGSPAGVLDQSIATPVGMLPYGIAVSVDGQILVVGTSVNTTGTMARATLANRNFTDLPQANGGQLIADADFTASGATAWVSNLPGGQASKVNPATGVASFSTPGLAAGNRYSVQVSADGARVYVGGEGEVAVLNAGTGAVTRNIPILSIALSMVPNPAAPDHLFTAGEGSVQDVDAITGTVQTIGTFYAKNLGMSPDGAKLYLVNESAELLVVNRLTAAVLQTWTLPCGAWGVAVSPDGLKVVATCSTSGIILVLDASNGNVINSISVGGSPRRIAFTTDGLLALVSDESGFVHIIR